MQNAECSRIRKPNEMHESFKVHSEIHSFPYRKFFLGSTSTSLTLTLSDDYVNSRFIAIENPVLIEETEIGNPIVTRWNNSNLSRVRRYESEFSYNC